MEHWRTGTKCHRTLHRVTDDTEPKGVDIGRMDTPEDAALVVEAMNYYLNRGSAVCRGEE